MLYLPQSSNPNITHAHTQTYKHIYAGKLLLAKGLLPAGLVFISRVTCTEPDAYIVLQI